MKRTGKHYLMDYLVRAGSLEGFEALVLSLGGNPVTLMQQVGLTTSAIRDPDTLISYPKMTRLLELSASACNNETFGLQLSANQGLFTVGAMGLYMAQQQSILDSLNVALPYIHMHAQGAILTLEPNNDGYRLSFQTAFSGQKQSQQLTQLSINLICRIIKTMAGEQWHPEKISFTQSKPITGSNEFRKIINCPIEFSADANAIYLSKRTLALQPNCDQEQLRQHISHHFKILAQSYPNQLEAQICHSIRALLPTGDCSLENISAMLDLHPRVLQKKLKKNQSSFSALLEKTRSEIACNLIAHSHISLTELALQLGFAELAVFSRSFKKWHGISPNQWRKQHLTTDD